MTPASPLRKSLVALFLSFALVAWAPLAFASDHGAAAAPAPLRFVVNLGDPSSGGKYLQVQMVFEGATPEMEHLVSVFQPKIQHALILLLSEEQPDVLLTLQGKKNLTANIIETVNHLLHETPKTGVKDVFFTSFIIQ